MMVLAVVGVTAKTLVVDIMSYQHVQHVCWVVVG
jgi:hypothetical protein